MLSGGTGTDSDESTRDRLFDVVMRRLDALRPHKAGVRAVVIGLRRDPLSLVCMMPCFARSMAWMLEAAEVSGGGVSGRMRVRGLGIIYVSVLRTWFRDDSEDMAKTMATLDRALERADAAVKSAPFGCLGRAEKEVESAA